MKIAHFSVFAPHACGLYHSVKDLILAERSVGIEAEFVDFGHDGKMSYRPGLKDGEITTMPQEYAEQADIVISHSAVPNAVRTKKPSILALHGRPEATFRMEFNGVLPIMSTVLERVATHNYKAIITFWEDYMYAWSRILPGKKVLYVPAPIDFDTYNPEGKKHQFKKSGNPNIVIADIWREDVIPFNLVIAAQYFKEKYYNNAKVHIYALEPKRHGKSFDFLNSFHKVGLLGELSGIVTNLDEIYRSADMVITPNIIATRIIRESLASGTPIVAPVGCKFTEFQAEPRDYKAFALEMKRCFETKHDKQQIRNKLLEKFNPTLVGETMRVICKPFLAELAPNPCMWNGVDLSKTIVQAGKEPKVVSDKQIKMAIVYDPLDSKMRDDTYSYMFKGMFEALVEKFKPVHITDNCNAKDIDANVIIFWDGNSCHDITIEGIDKHPALKMEYLSDPFQKEVHGAYPQWPDRVIHKLSAEQRIERVLRRGIKYILSSNKVSYFRRFVHLLGADRAEKMLTYFPHAPWFEPGTSKLNERKKEVLANGSMGHEIYEFRKWAFQRSNVTVVPHFGMNGNGPKGKEYPGYLKTWAGALALCDEFPVPKYYEIPMAGCVAFFQYHEECKEIGFNDYESCVYVNKDNFDERIKDFINDVGSYQMIADRGRKLMENNYTAKHYADFVERKILNDFNSKT